MQIVILGNGISGITAAIRLRQMSDHNITVISSEADYFYSRTALMYIYMGHMRKVDTQPYPSSFWKEKNIDLLNAHVEDLDLSTRSLIMRNGKAVNFDKLILAVGSKPNRFDWPGQDLKGVSGLYTLQDLQTMEDHSANLQRAVIIGGGLIGIEMAEMFLSRDIPVTMLVRESEYWDNVLPREEAAMISNHIRAHGVDLRLETELSEITGDIHGRVKRVLTKTGEAVECGFVGLTAGVSPNIEFLKGSGLETDQGILVDDHLCTNHPDVYAVGDCAQIRRPRAGRRPIEPVWYTGRIMGEVVAYNVLDQPVEYDPGLWFNSAKFLDIEYQVYGHIPTQEGPEIGSILWQDQAQNRSVRIAFDRRSGQVVGFNLLGVRFRQEVCEKWITDETPLDQVLTDIRLAGFDPEFYRDLSDKLLQSFNEQLRENFVARPTSLDDVTKFLNA